MKKTILLLLVCVLFLTATAQPSKAAFVSSFASLVDLQNNGDDDEAAAATWLVNTYGGVFLPVSQIKNSTVNLSDYKALWIHFDRQSDETTINNEFAAAFLDADVKTAINNFYKAGGNLLLSTYATRYVTDLGRYDLAIDLKGFGNGGNNPDVWSASPTWGTFVGAAEVFNKISDSLYDDLTGINYILRDNGNTYPIIPLLGAGWKEDHNYFWNPQPDKANNDNYKYIDFQNVWSTNSLATWAHVQDYFGTAITRWNTKGDYNGTAITIGIGSYEWNQNSGTNAYHSNITQLTKNALDELSPLGISTDNIINSENDIKMIINEQYIRIENARSAVVASIYAINGKLIHSYQFNQIQNQFDISNLHKGMYIIETIVEGKSTITKFIK